MTSLGNGLAPSFAIFVAWRMLGGVAIGLASNLSPMYIAEVAPAAMRGRLVAINQLTIVIGILAAQFINWCDRPRPARGAPATSSCTRSWYGQAGWRWMFALTAVPSLLFFVGMFFVPESPRWLVKNGQASRARGVLARIGGSRYAEAELPSIQATLAGEEIRARAVRDLLEPRMRRVLVLGRGAGRLPAVVRHQRDLQLRRGDLPGRRLRHLRRAQEHRLDRLGELGLHVRRAGHSGPRRAPAADAAGLGGLAVIYMAMGLCYTAASRGCPCCCWCWRPSAATPCRWPR